MNIHPYVPGKDNLHDLWQGAFGQTWPITPVALTTLLEKPLPHRANTHFIAYEEDRMVGFVAIQHPGTESQSRYGNIMALYVDPAMHRQGVGTALLNHAVDFLREKGMNKIQLGGGSRRFWPGVPQDLPHAVEFFKKRGWSFVGTTVDLTQDLANFQPNPKVIERMNKEQVQIEPAYVEDIPELLQFEEREFAGWLPDFQYIAGLGDERDILVARDTVKGHIVGSLLMFAKWSHPDRMDIAWKSMLGEDMGAFGEVGVGKDEQGRGIGIALVERASQLLKIRGVRNCHIGWTTLADFYARSGYAVWRTFEMSVREI